MRTVFTTVLIALFGLSIVGCRASAEVEGDDDGRDTYSKKTTTVDREGNRTVKTEVKKTD